MKFHAAPIDGDGAQVELDLVGKRLDVTVDLARQTFIEDAHGSRFSHTDRAQLLALRDAIGELEPDVIDTPAGRLLVRTADRYAEVPVGRARARLEIDLRTTGEGKADDVTYGCIDDGTTCFPGTSGASWAVFRGSASCRAEQAYYGDSGCRGRCGMGCSWWDEDYTWDCFDHDVCLDYQAGCDDEWDDAVDDWLVTSGPYCWGGSSRDKPDGPGTCGNGDIEVGEACDDNNTVPGDGCSAACQVELVSLDFDRPAIVVRRRQSASLRLIGTYADGTVRETWGPTVWTSTDQDVVEIGLGGAMHTWAAGTETITATLAGHTAKLVVTVRDEPCMPTINEVQTAGETAADEWVELFNGCEDGHDLTGWSLVYRSASATGATDTARLVTFAGQFGAGEPRLYRSAASAPVENDGQWTHGGSSGALGRLGGAVGLRDASGKLVDSIGWGTIAAGHPFVEGNKPAPRPVVGGSCGRAVFDGIDSDVNATDFVVTEPGGTTPRDYNGL